MALPIVAPWVTVGAIRPPSVQPYDDSHVSMSRGTGYGSSPWPVAVLRGQWRPAVGRKQLGPRLRGQGTRLSLREEPGFGQAAKGWPADAARAGNKAGYSKARAHGSNANRDQPGAFPAAGFEPSNVKVDQGYVCNKSRGG